MKIILDKKAGFCFGVRRAINLTVQEALKKENVYTLGPIIHNPQEVKRLTDLGVTLLGTINDFVDGTVIIRTHGISPQEYAKLEKSCKKVIDGTCPLVKRSHMVVEKLKQEGYRIIIVGDSNHPEIIALLGYAGENTLVIESTTDLRGIPLGGKVGVIAQTTLSKEVVQEILAHLTTKVIELKYINTLCGITLNQKKSASQLAKEADIMLVIGGKNSSNTTKLAAICKNIQKRTYLIESSEEIEPGWFHSDDVVGITAGASTPQWVLQDVVNAVEKFSLQFCNRSEFQYVTHK